MSTDDSVEVTNRIGFSPSTNLSNSEVAPRTQGVDEAIYSRSVHVKLSLTWILAVMC